MLLLPERRKKFEQAIKDDETLLARIVRDAIVDLRGCKQEEIDNMLNELRQALKTRVKPDDMRVFQRKLDKMRITLPEDIVAKISQAEEFSR